MKIAVLKERRSDERRVAASPETVKKLAALGASVAVESGAGAQAGFMDDAYEGAGATVAKTAKATLADADVVLKVRAPLAKGPDGDELKDMPKGAVLVGLLDPYTDPGRLRDYADAGLISFSMELVPRITRAQAMDALSSQSNLAGYRAVLDGAAAFSRAFPLMMTAAGTVPPARVFVIGAGVAGLQAIATARRLGAVVSATDVRPAAREQVESLGATFVMVDSEEAKQAETAGGYAKEMSDEYKRAQAELVRETLRKQDIVITTALIPGRKAPVLISAEMVAEMKPGTVVVDMAVEQGGNVEGSKLGETVTTGNGVVILGYENMPSRIATDASALYARNLLSFLTPLVDKDSGKLAFDWEDRILAESCLTRDGAIVHEGLADLAGAKKAAPAKPDADEAAKPAAAAKPKRAPAKKPAAAKKPTAKKATATKKAAAKPAAKTAAKTAKVEPAASSPGGAAATPADTSPAATPTGAAKDES